MAIIIGTVFLNLGTGSDDISKRSVLLFYSVLVNAFMSGFEVPSLNSNFLFQH
jgi:ATP-binding cassette subfamily G (WHITE) protein 2 (PDR)